MEQRSYGYAWVQCVCVCVTYRTLELPWYVCGFVVVVCVLTDFVFVLDFCSDFRFCSRRTNFWTFV